MKHTLVLFFFILFCNCLSFAQFPNWSWAKHAGNGVNDYGNGIAVTNNNMIYVVGQFNNTNITFGAIVLTNAGKAETNDIFIAKYDMLGNVLWAKSIGGTDDDFGISIVPDKLGNIYITGGFSSNRIIFGKDTLKNIGQSGTNDIFVAKYTPSGEIDWAKIVGGKNDDKANCIAIDKDANVYITGSFGSPKIVFQQGDTLNNMDGSGSSEDIFLAKYNTSGKLIWAKSVAGKSEDHSCGIVCDSHNNVYLTGGSYSNELKFDSIRISNSPFGDDEKKFNEEEVKARYMFMDSLGNVTDTTGMKKLKNKPGRYIQVMPHQRTYFEKIFIAKYSASGKLQWAEIVGGSDDEEASSITADVHDNLFITGRFQSSSITMDSTTLSNEGSNDIFIAKYSSDGKVFWAKSVGGIEDDRGNNIKTDAYGNAYITGWFASPKAIFGKSSLKNSGGKGYTDLFIAKYDTDGNALWAENAKGSDSDWSNGVDIDSFGNIYLTGGFDSPEIDFGSTKLINGKSKDFFLAKINAK